MDHRDDNALKNLHSSNTQNLFPYAENSLIIQPSKSDSPHDDTYDKSKVAPTRICQELHPVWGTGVLFQLITTEFEASRVILT